MKKTLYLAVCLSFLCVGCLQAADAPIVDVPVIILSSDTDEAQVRSAVFSPDGQTIVTASADATARIWDVQTGKEFQKLEGHQSQVRSAVFFPDGKKVLTKSDDDARIWDAESGKELQKFPLNRVNNFAVLSPEGKKIALIGAWPNKNVLIYDSESGKEIQRLGGHAGNTTSVVFSPDGKKIATAGWDGSNAEGWEAYIRIWDTDSDSANFGRELRAWTDQVREGVSVTVTFSPDSKKIISHDTENRRDATSVRIWDVDSGKELQTLKHRREIKTAVFSPDGSKIVTACGDGVGRIWDVESGEELHLLEGHYSTCAFAVFSPDGKQVVTGCGVSFVTGIEGGHVLVFDADSGEMLHRLLGHRGLVRFGAFSPDGKKIASISSDNIRIWDLSAIRIEEENQ